ncbi:MAG: hypothetical protein K0S32_2284 [Bacteroidetes bacterium]|nr:hypothetical protein [Bacteroidota bacterium]
MKNKQSIKKGTIYLALSSFIFLACTFNPRANAASRGEAGIETRKEITNLGVEPNNVMVAAPTYTTDTKTGKRKIKIALLLDTSNSMDGLIDQAKAQLWKIVNELALARYGEEKPELEIALYEYGNQGLSKATGYIRQVSKFSNDLDSISTKLFSLTTNGGDEYCGHAIQTATKQLSWLPGSTDLQVIFIAGNEPFTQGLVNANTSCARAKEKDIFINTIFCGDYEEGLNTGWKNGALLAEGNYMCINQNAKTQYIETPYDSEIAALNSKLNATYVPYGGIGESRLNMQLATDGAAANYGTANTSERVVSKTSAVYTNVTWDAVDATSKTKDFKITKVKEQDLPKELKGKTDKEKEEYIAKKTKEREEVSKQITDLNKKRIEYIAEKKKELAKTNATNMLDDAMMKAIREQAKKKNFTFASTN